MLNAHTRVRIPTVYRCSPNLLPDALPFSPTKNAFSLYALPLCHLSEKVLFPFTAFIY